MKGKKLLVWLLIVCMTVGLLPMKTLADWGSFGPVEGGGDDGDGGWGSDWPPVGFSRVACNIYGLGVYKAEDDRVAGKVEGYDSVLGYATETLYYDFTVTVNEGFYLADLKINDGAVGYYLGEDGKYHTELPHADITIQPVFLPVGTTFSVSVPHYEAIEGVTFTVLRGEETMLTLTEDQDDASFSAQYGDDIHIVMTQDGAAQTVYGSVNAIKQPSGDTITLPDSTESWDFSVPGENVELSLSAGSYWLFTITAGTDQPDYGTVTILHDGTVSEGGVYNKGDELMLVATPNEGCSFARWTENGELLSEYETYSLTVTGNRSFQAEFTKDPLYYTIRLNAEPDGVSFPVGEGVYQEGAEVTLISSVGVWAGYEFDSWRENGQIVSRNDYYRFTASGDRNLTAYFVEAGKHQYDIHVEASDPRYGTVSGMGYWYQYQTVRLFAEPRRGFGFVAWKENGAVVCTDPFYSFQPTGDRNLVAEFTRTEGTVLIDVEWNPKFGSVSGDGGYPTDGTVTLTAEPALNYDFNGWIENGNVISTETNYTFTATTDRKLTANFVRHKYDYSIIVDKFLTQGGTVTGGGDFDAGALVEVRAIPESAYVFVGWTENGEPVSTETVYTFTASEDRYLRANFVDKANPLLTVSATTFPLKGGTITGTGQVAMGGEVTVRAAASLGYEFVCWMENDTVLSMNPEYTFIAHGHRSLTAKFRAVPYETGASLTETLTVGHGITVLNLDTPHSGANAITVTPLEEGTQYDVVYADGTAENPVHVIDMGRTVGLEIGNSTAFLPAPEGAQRGMLLQLYVQSGSVRLEVTNASESAMLVGESLNASPLRVETLYTGQGIVSLSDRYPTLMIGVTPGTNIWRMTEVFRANSAFGIEPSKDRYYYWDSHLTIVEYQNGQRTETMYYPYDKALEYNEKTYSCVFLTLSPTDTEREYGFLFYCTAGNAIIVQEADYNWPQEMTLEIGSEADWNAYAERLTEGFFDASNFKLTADISVSVPFGTAEHPFRGTFDGQGHTLTVNLTDTANSGTAPFRAIRGATIRNLVVEGSVTGGDYAAGLVGICRGMDANTIENCTVRAAVANPFESGDRRIGGVVGNSGAASITLQDIVFSGSLSSGGSAGGLLGWSTRQDENRNSALDSVITLQRCLFMGSYSGDGSFHPTGMREWNTPPEFRVNDVYSTLDFTFYDYQYVIPGGFILATQTAPQTGLSRLFLFNGSIPLYLSVSVSGLRESYRYTGEAIHPVFTLTDAKSRTLTADTDYTAVFSDSEIREAKTYTLTVSGIGEVTGSVTIPFAVTYEDTVRAGGRLWHIVQKNDTEWYVISANPVGTGTQAEALALCEEVFDGFTAEEQLGVLRSTKAASTYTVGEVGFQDEALSGATLFLPSAQEADAWFGTNEERLPGLWWLRSIGGYVTEDGRLDTTAVSETLNVRPAFRLNPDMVCRVDVATEGHGTASGFLTCLKGVTVEVSAEPEEGYRFLGWKENGEIVSRDAVYSFTVAEDHELTAVFGIYYQIDCESYPEGGILYTNAESALPGTRVLLVYAALNGYVCDAVTVTDSQGNIIPTEAMDGEDVRCFTMPEDDVTVRATFLKKVSFNSETGELRLVRGSFNENAYARWVSGDVPAHLVKSIVADPGVRFEGDCTGLFQGFAACETIDFSNVNTADLTGANRMFSGCTSLTSINLNGWALGSLTDVHRMFYGCTSLTEISFDGWEDAPLEDLSEMLAGCTALARADLSALTIDQWADTTDLLRGADALRELTLPAGVAVDAAMGLNNEGIGWMADGSETVLCEGQSEVILPASEEAVTWRWALDVKGPRWTLEEGALTLNWGSFSHADSWATKEPDGYGLTVTSVTGAEGVRFVDDCTGLFSLFDNCVSMDLSLVDTSEMTNMYCMFSGCGSLTTLHAESWDTSQVTNMHEVFNNCEKLTGLDLSGWDTSAVTDMTGLFSWCEALETLDLAGWDTGNVTTMESMFYGCTGLTGLDLSTWNTANVETMFAMFDYCESLLSLDLSGWDTSSVTNMCWMFEGCENLTSLDLGDWNTSAVTDMRCMFVDCTALEELDLSGFDTSHTFLPGEDEDDEDASGVSYLFAGADALCRLTLSPHMAITEEMMLNNGDPNAPGWSEAHECMGTVVSGDGEYAVIEAPAVTTTFVWKDLAEPAIVITQQPADVAVPLGEIAETTVIAEGEGLKYQWYGQDRGGNVFKSGLRGDTYSVALVKSKAGREVWCVITDAAGHSITTRRATLSVELPASYAAPHILTEPVSATALPGETVSVTVEAEGHGTLSYQWYFRNGGSGSWSTSGTRTDTYSVTMNASRNGRELFCVISDEFGNSVTSEIVTIGYYFPENYAGPVITAQPQDTSVDLGETATLTVEADGAGTLSYQWFFRNEGSTGWSRSSIQTNTYSVEMNPSRSGRELYCVVTDMYGTTVQSQTATIRFAYPENYTAPVIRTEPTDVYVDAGEVASTSFVAEGMDLTYQWFLRDPGAEKFSRSSLKGDTYSVTMVAAKSGREVYCVVTDKYGATAVTETVTLHMQIPEGYELKITSQPTDCSAAKGEIASTTVVAEGAGLKYQWYGIDPDGRTFTSGLKGDTYSLTMVPAKSGRRVYCVITDKYGNSVTSETATLTISES